MQYSAILASEDEAPELGLVFGLRWPSGIGTTHGPGPIARVLVHT